ncbi:MAG TPA: nicotinate-nucleotide adenylyltransferase [Thermoleophilia bacterium]|nr:nicotinate-nucleotide adenylyltransferase [Thermoleophilia bacterium]
MDEARPRLGVLGGSFDPPHLGHLVIASEAHAQHGLERVLFAPAAAPPHKVMESSTLAGVRLEMTALAVEDDERFAVSEVEMERGLVFTRDTIAAVAAHHPGYELAFIMGSDSLLQFDTWHSPGGVLELCTLLVAVRPGDDRRSVAAAAARWGADAVVVIDAPLIGVSSSAVRARVAAGLPIRYLVPAAVETFVRERGLYRSS